MSTTKSAGRDRLRICAEGHKVSGYPPSENSKAVPFCTASHGNNAYCSASPGLFAQASETQKAPMRALLIISVIFAVTSLTARSGVTYTITSYPGGLADLPCDAFEKNADGSWTQVAILVGGAPLFRPAVVSKTLPRRASSNADFNLVAL
jgi:hypothetical protein